MGKFNTKLVDSLDVLNKVLAVIFMLMAAAKFVEIVPDNFLGAVFESLAVIGIGVLTCGYIAVMININTNIETLMNKGHDKK